LENFVVLARTVLIQLTSVTDRRTDRQRDGRLDDGCERTERGESGTGDKGKMYFQILHYFLQLDAWTLRCSFSQHSPDGEVHALPTACLFRQLPRQILNQRVGCWPFMDFHR